MRPRLFAIALLAISMLAPTRAEDVPPAPAAPVTDPALVSAHLHEVLARPEFAESATPDINSRFKDMLSQWFLRLGRKIGEYKYASRIPAFESMLMTFLVGFAIAGLLYTMLRLTRRRSGPFDEFESSEPGVTPRRPPEYFEEAIARAVGAADWRSAWLASWRQFLARLEAGDLIAADRTATNREYLAHLRGQPLPAPALAMLTALVDSYDRAIYGRRTIAEPDWTAFRQQLGEAALLLHLNEKRTAP